MKKLNTLKQIVSILTIILVCMTVLPEQSAQAEENILYSEPLSGPVGTTVTLEGIYFTPSVLAGVTSNITRVSRAGVYFPDKNTLVKTVVIDTWGKISTSIEIGEYPAGKYAIWIQDETAGPLAWVSVPFTIVPEIKVSKLAGYTGDVLIVSGTGFKDSSFTSVYYSGKRLGTFYTNNKGSFSNELITIPDCKNGDYDIIVTDTRGNEAKVSFTSQRQKLDIFPDAGSPGSNINIIGTNFEALTNISFKLYNTTSIVQYIETIPETIVTDYQGNFDAYLEVPSCKSNSYILEASDGTFRACATLSVSTTGFFDREIGFIGSNVTFSGNGFIPYKYTVASFDGIPLAEYKADGLGASTMTIPIPPCQPGEHVLSVTDGITTFSNVFTVISKASLEINRTTGTIGSELYLTGKSFVPEKMAVISFDTTTISETPIDSSGAFSANFTIPVCESGAHTITVTDSMNTLNLTVHVEYQKIPQVSLITPDKLGISGADVTLSWNGLQGFSDAVYTIQIARDDSFSPEALVLQETGIRNTFYQYYSDASVLSEIVLTPFYWRIRAESAMTVPGEWSEAREFLMILPPVSVNQAGSTNPLLQYGLFIEMGALGLLVVFWILRKKTKSAKKVRASQKA